MHQEITKQNSSSGVTHRSSRSNHRRINLSLRFMIWHLFRECKSLDVRPSSRTMQPCRISTRSDVPIWRSQPIPRVRVAVDCPVRLERSKRRCLRSALDRFCEVHALVRADGARSSPLTPYIPHEARSYLCIPISLVDPCSPKIAEALGVFPDSASGLFEVRSKFRASPWICRRALCTSIGLSRGAPSASSQGSKVSRA
jgi:hypothetical protein